MVVQARAGATRQRIIDAAVDLFADKGYAETGLNDLCKAADVTTGAFYYHFASKEEVADAVGAQGWPKAWDVVAQYMNPDNPGLENVIAMTFAVTDLLKRDKSVWISNHLNQSLGLLNEAGRKTFAHRAQSFTAGIAASVRPSDLRAGISHEDVGSQVWMMLHGCHLLSDAFGDDVSKRLVASWRILLQAIAAEESLPHFEKLVATQTD